MTRSCRRLPEEVFSIARMIRKEVERSTAENPYISTVDLAGACGIASYALWRVLRRRGYRPTLVCATGSMGSHCWVELGGYVIDLTATQFGDYPKVYVVQAENYRIADDLVDEDERVRIHRNNRAVAELRWWGGQSPSYYKTEISALVTGLTPPSRQ